MKNTNKLYQVVNYYEERIGQKMPYLFLIMKEMEIVFDEDVIQIKTDGRKLYINPDYLWKQSKKNLYEIEELLCHIFLHVMFLHPDNATRSIDFYDEKVDKIVCEKIKNLGYRGEVLDDHEMWYLKKSSKQNEQSSHPSVEPSGYEMKEEKEREGEGEGEGQGDQKNQMKETANKETDFLLNYIIGSEERNSGVSQNSNSQKMGNVGDAKVSFKERLKKYYKEQEIPCPVDYDMDMVLYHYGQMLEESLLIVEEPEVVEVQSAGVLVIAIDTSGSCSGEKVKQFLSEVYQCIADCGHFEKNGKVLLLLADSEIRQKIWITQESEIPDINDLIISGGGTDFRPVFQYVDTISESEQEFNVGTPDVLLYFTDGFGPFPVDRPNYPVLICLDNQSDGYWGGATIPEWAEICNING